MLRNSEDWELFWFALEGVARSSETSVFKFIDVYDQANHSNASELPNIPDAPELPEQPEVTETRNNSQVSQIFDLKLPEISGYRAHNDFIYAIKSIDGEYSKYLSIQLEKKRKKDKVPLLTEIIEDFRNHQRREEASMALDRDIGGNGKVVAATFKEEAGRKDGKDFGEKKGIFEGKECMCGLIHAWATCFYLNPSMRKTTWKGKKEVFEKINKQLKNINLKWVVKKTWKPSRLSKIHQKIHQNLLGQLHTTQEVRKPQQF
ncbi:hypothetical protein K3495_g6920 [Podosphaera aphanis]|nr:hypothetical protein K3495_g6920 [Podosphaera aphanis]